MSEKRKRGYSDRDRLQDYRATFTTPEGKRVLNDMMARHFMFSATTAADDAGTNFNEGQRNVVLEILRYMEMKPADLPQVRTSMAEQFGLTEEIMVHD